jgi:UTP--glucose-1-phosphate uridylyltransferase
MAQMIGRQPFHAVTFHGDRYDCGDKIGFLEACVLVALGREDMASDARAVI